MDRGPMHGGPMSCTCLGGSIPLPSGTGLGISPKISGISHSLQGGCAFFSNPAKVASLPTSAPPGLSKGGGFGGTDTHRRCASPLVSCPARWLSTPMPETPGLSEGAMASATSILGSPPCFSTGQVWFDTHFTTAGSFSRAMPVTKTQTGVALDFLCKGFR